MRGRLFQRFQQRVEGVAAQHVNFVDNIDLVACRDRGIAHRLDDLAHVVDASVAGGVHLDHVDMAAFRDGDTRLAHAARIDRRAALPIRPNTIQRFGDQARGRGLAHPAHAGHQEGMGQPVARDRIGERADHRFLPDQFRKGLGPVFAREHAIGLRRIGCGRLDHGFRGNREGDVRRFFRRRHFGCWRRGGFRFGSAEHRSLAHILQFGGAGRVVVRSVARSGLPREAV